MLISGRDRSFTLLELLVVVAVISVLIGILLPAVNAAREQAEVIKACAELKNIADALKAYSFENHDKYPPARTFCDMDKREHWSELPPELVDSSYLPAGPEDSYLSSAVEDQFNPGHTYKYTAPGWGYHNTVKTVSALWVPDDFPKDRVDADPESISGKVYDNLGMPTDGDGNLIPSPVDWVVYSVGPRYDPEKGLGEHYPVPRCTWYKGCGTSGVIPVMKTRDGFTITWR